MDSVRSENPLTTSAPTTQACLRISSRQRSRFLARSPSPTRHPRRRIPGASVGYQLDSESGGRAGRAGPITRNSMSTQAPPRSSAASTIGRWRVIRPGTGRVRPGRVHVPPAPLHHLRFARRRCRSAGRPARSQLGVGGRLVATLGWPADRCGCRGRRDGRRRLRALRRRLTHTPAAADLARLARRVALGQTLAFPQAKPGEQIGSHAGPSPCRCRRGRRLGRRVADRPVRDDRIVHAERRRDVVVVGAHRL